MGKSTKVPPPTLVFLEEGPPIYRPIGNSSFEVDPGRMCRIFNSKAHRDDWLAQQRDETRTATTESVLLCVRMKS
jgi:hypothetical protein